MIRLRPFHVSDAWTTRRIFHDAVRVGAAARYTPEQRAVWSPSAVPPEGWADRLADQITLIAEEVTSEADIPVGFGTMRRDGHLDLLYVTPTSMGTGVSGRIHDALLDAVAEYRPERLTATASLYAKPFLARRGWRLLGGADSLREGVVLPAYDMDRTPPAATSSAA